MPHKDPEAAKAYWIARRQTKEHKEYQKALRKKKIAENPEYRLDGQFRYNYGISLEQYNAMFASQSGKCGICGTHQSALAKRLCVDHCHSTGLVRGLLCIQCNHAIGKLKDSEDLLFRAIQYLREAGARPAIGDPVPKRKGRPPKMQQPGGSKCPAI